MKIFTDVRASDGDRFTVIQLREGRIEVAANAFALRGERPGQRLAVLDLDRHTAILVGRALIEAGESMGGTVPALGPDAPTYILTDYGREVLEREEFAGFSIASTEKTSKDG